MSKFRQANAARDAHITTLRVVIAVLIVFSAAMWWGWKAAPQHLTINNPPSLATGSTRPWWVVPSSSVYAFTLYVWQAINRWPKDGGVDFKDNLRAYSAYLTPSCQSYLQEEYNTRKNHHELQDRVRGVYEIPGHGYRQNDVTVLNRNHWVVKLNLGINETLHDTPVRRLFVRYDLRVVRAAVDPQHNPWGLQIDCFAKPPVRLTVPKQDKTGQPGGTKPSGDAANDGMNGPDDRQTASNDTENAS